MLVASVIILTHAKSRTGPKAMPWPACGSGTLRCEVLVDKNLLMEKNQQKDKKKYKKYVGCEIPTVLIRAFQKKTIYAKNIFKCWECCRHFWPRCSGRIYQWINHPYGCWHMIKKGHTFHSLSPQLLLILCKCLAITERGTCILPWNHNFGCISLFRNQQTNVVGWKFVITAPPPLSNAQCGAKK